MFLNGHAVKLQDGGATDRVWYIPHHCTGAKFRVVFDSAAVYKGTSLNANLLQGPDHTNCMIGVLFRFREHPVAFMADIKSMFFQVKVPTRDQSALRFLWWENGEPGGRVEDFQMTVHTFGLVSSPSVAGSRCNARPKK